MDNFDLKKYLVENKFFKEGDLIDDSSLESLISQYISQTTDLLDELKLLNVQQNLPQIKDILSSIKYNTDELDYSIFDK